jgi:protein-L-isoaspartate(D-aspartate) O-methyltransferase
MIIPVGRPGGQVLRRYIKESEEAYAVMDLMAVRFVPLLPDIAKADESADD